MTRTTAFILMVSVLAMLVLIGRVSAPSRTCIAHRADGPIGNTILAYCDGQLQVIHVR